MKAERKSETPGQRRARRQSRAGGPVALVATGRPIVTYVIIAITAFISLLQMIPGVVGDTVSQALVFWAPYLYPAITGLPFEPWRLLTAMLVHGGLWHLALNMLALWMLGRSLEPMLGRWRFATLYILSGLAGSVAMACISPMSATVGASGAIFGLFGALLVIGRHIGANIRGLAVVLGLNLVVGFVFAGQIAWQAHVGGLAIGALIGFIFARTRRREQRTTQILLLIAVAVGLIALLVIVPPLIIQTVI
jgi:membrane associated rhomboid family serine protease